MNNLLPHTVKRFGVTGKEKRLKEILMRSRINRYGKTSDNFRRIVPVESDFEKINFVNSMFCPICKEKKHCEIIATKEMVKEGYHYELSQIKCSNCETSFDIEFFNSMTIENLKNYRN